MPYLLAFFWLDGHRTFDIPDPPPLAGPDWKYRSSGGQGQADIWEVFLFDHPVNVGPPPDEGGGGVVDCNPDAIGTIFCFGQLVN